MYEHLFVSPLDQSSSNPWVDLHIPSVPVADWDVDRIHDGLRQLERIRRELEAVTAELVAVLPETRDASTSLARETGISRQEARRRRRVAAAVAGIPRVLALLAAGAISAEHAASLVPMIGDGRADEFAAAAVHQTPDQVAAAVRRHLLDREHGSDTAARQHACRSLRFFEGPDGMLGFSGLLPPMEGATLKAWIAAIVDARWKAEHPERARIAGGHGGDTRAQRQADALLELIGITNTGSATAADPNAGWPTPPPANVDSSDPADMRANAGDGSTANPTNAATASRTSADVTPNTDRPPVGTTVKTGKPAVIIVFDVERYRAEMIGHGPIPVTANLFDLAKHDLYYAFTTMRGETLKFGRARREPTPIQRLAAFAANPTCVYPGCTTPATECDLHHVKEWVKDQGFTDIENLAPVCNPHHRHLDVEELIIVREPDRSITVRHRHSGRIVAIGQPERQAA